MDRRGRFINTTRGRGLATAGLMPDCSDQSSLGREPAEHKHIFRLATNRCTVVGPDPQDADLTAQESSDGWRPIINSSHIKNVLYA